MRNFIKFMTVAAIACVSVSCEKEQVNKLQIPESCEAVDLGLSVLWASCNVGAKSEADPGAYFAWGETRDKKFYGWGEEGQYKWGTYQTSLPTNGMTKYVNGEIGGDGINILKADDDAATKNWGSKWRMPTEDEFNELVDKSKCQWTWDEERKGYIIKGLATENTIFLPAAGMRDLDELKEFDDSGYYWSSEVDHNESYRAVQLMFYSEEIMVGYYFRKTGACVRAVQNKE